MREILKLQDVSKTFPGVKALDNVTINFEQSEVHAVVGENGAGKSTLMKIIAALYRHDSGQVIMNGKEIHFQSPVDAIKNGIAMIHQELTPIPHMKVYENIFIGREIQTKLFKIINRRAMIEATNSLFNDLEIEIDPNVIIKDLSVAERQLIEIAKAISFQPQILIMDEPTSALTEKEVEHLYKVVKQQQKQGITILYISHKLDEVFALADRVTVLRDGKKIGTEKVGGVTKVDLIKMMVGRDVEIDFVRSAGKRGDKILEVKNLSNGVDYKDISFELHRGEILGIAGLMGSGRTELAETIMGLRRHEKGTIYINGDQRKIKHPKEAIESGIALIPEDRKEVGLNIGLSVEDNMMLPNLNNYSNFGLVKQNKLRHEIRNYINKLRIKTPGLKSLVNSLSGGNQQKVVVAKWLIANTDILILDEPTRGIDVGAKSEIHHLIDDLANSGKAVIIISSELTEIQGLSDRVMVLYKGEMTGLYEISEFKEEHILKEVVSGEGVIDE
jgi:inositol transport system ATP-binding protein